MFASHAGVETMRMVTDQGKTGLETVREAVGDAGALIQPEESWTGRAVMDTKVEFILTGLENHWPET